LGGRLCGERQSRQSDPIKETTNPGPGIIKENQQKVKGGSPTVAGDGQSALVSQGQFGFGKGNFRGVVAAVVGRGRRSSQRVAVARQWPAAEELLRRRGERMGMGRRVSVRLLVLGLLVVELLLLLLLPKMMMMMLLEVVVVVTAALRRLRRRLLRPPAALLNGMTGRCLMIAR